MKNCWLILWCCFSSLFAFSQVKSQADVLYSNFEYALAAKGYESQGASNLSPNQTENLLVCYYILLNDEKGLPLVNQLLNQNMSNINHWLFKARFEKEKGSYDDAIQSANKYLELGGVNLPTGFVRSCEFSQRYTRTVSGALINSTNNTTKANFITKTGNKTLFFKEVGVDSLRKITNSDELEEAFLLRPFTETNGQLTEWKLLPENELLSIQSLQVDLENNAVYFSATRPAGSNVKEIKSKIYKADFNGFDAPLSNIEVWKSAGISENDVVGQVALSPNGKLLVFSKLIATAGTSDLFVSSKSENSWNQMQPVAFLNTSEDESFPSFFNDTTLCFSSNGRLGYGDLDIYRCKVLDGLMIESPIYQFLAPLNSASDDFLWMNDGKDVSTFCSNRKSTVGDDDVWSISSNDILVRYAGKIAGDKDNNGFIDEGEIAGDIDEDGIINNGEIAGDINGDRNINEGEIAGDVNANMVIEGNEIAGDVDGNYSIDNGEITGDVNGNKMIDDNEIAGDVNGNKIIDNGEIAGDVDGNYSIDNGEITGDVNGNKMIDDNEIAGDVNGNKIIDNGEIAGDVNGNGKIDDGEIAGDVNGNKIIDDGEIAGDVSGNKIIDGNEIAGDVNGNGKIDDGEIAGDVNGNKIIDDGEIAGDVSGNKIIDGNEIAGDVNGNGKIDDGEIAGDVNGNKIIDNGELTGDINGNGIIDSDEILGDANGNRILDPWELGDDVEALLRLWSKEHILYDFDKPATKEQFSYLDKLKKFLDQGYVFNIEAVGHTDSRGLSQYNYNLGLRRVKEVKNILVQMGFKASNIKIRSVGEEELENECSDGQDCTEEEHKVNRFVNLNLSLKKVGKQ